MLFLNFTSLETITLLIAAQFFYQIDNHFEKKKRQRETRIFTGLFLRFV